MLFTDLRPDKILLVSVLVEGEWCDGDLEAYRQEDDGSFTGFVRWTRNGYPDFRGWLPEDRLRTSSRDSRKKQYGVITRVHRKLEEHHPDALD